MFKAIAMYLIGRKIVGFIVCAAMMIGLLAVCLIAYAFVPEARADEMNPYAGKYYKLDNEPDGTAFYVNNDGTVLVRYNDNLRVGQYLDYSVGENGELIVYKDGDPIFTGVTNDEGLLTDLDGNMWFLQD
jgi:hypothetical protein